MCPVQWEDGWPVFAPQTGKIEPSFTMEIDQLPIVDRESSAGICGDREYRFDTDELPKEFTFWGAPDQQIMELSDGELRLNCLPRRIDEQLRYAMDTEANARRDDCVAFVGIRQRSLSFQADTVMKFNPNAGDTAGLAVLQACNHQYRVEMGVASAESGEGIDRIVRLVRVTTTMTAPPFVPSFTAETKRETLIELPYAYDELHIRVVARGQRYVFFYGRNCDDMRQLGPECDARLINPRSINTMSGTLIGMFASGNGSESVSQAAFTCLRYRDLDNLS